MMEQARKGKDQEQVWAQVREKAEWAVRRRGQAEIAFVQSAEQKLRM